MGNIWSKTFNWSLATTSSSRDKSHELSRNSKC